MFRWRKRKWGARGPGSRTEKRPGSGSWGYSQGTWRQNAPCKNWSSWRPPGASVPSAARCRSAICGTQDWDLLRHWWMAGNWEPGNTHGAYFWSYTQLMRGKNIQNECITWQCVPVESSKWKTEDMKTHVRSPKRGRHTVPAIHVENDTLITSALSWLKMFEPGIILICKSEGVTFQKYSSFFSQEWSHSDSAR